VHNRKAPVAAGSTRQTAFLPTDGASRSGPVITSHAVHAALEADIYPQLPLRMERALVEYVSDFQASSRHRRVANMVHALPKAHHDNRLLYTTRLRRV